MEFTLTVAQAARLLGVSAATIGDMTKDGRLPYMLTIIGHKRFRKEDLLSVTRKKDDHLSSGQVAKLLGISVYMLNKIDPARLPVVVSEGRHREYKEEDVQRLIDETSRVYNAKPEASK